MRITHIVVKVGKTVQVKQFESYRFEVSLEGELQPGDDVDAEYEVLRTNALDKVNKQVARVLP